MYFIKILEITQSHVVYINLSFALINSQLKPIYTSMLTQFLTKLELQRTMPTKYVSLTEHPTMWGLS